MDTVSPLGSASERLAHWSLRLLGGFELCELTSGAKVSLPGKRDRVLLAYLALSPGCRQPRRKLTALLWGDAADETALDNLRVCIWSLRKALGDAQHRVIASEGEDIVLDAAAFEIDVISLRLVSHAGRHELEQAVKLASAEFLAGLTIESQEFESWRRDEAMRCKDQGLAVLTRLMTHLADQGETERAIEAGARILRLEPLHEEAVRRLMRLYGESGRRGAAIELYRSLADALHKELNVRPEAKTRAVFEEMSCGPRKASLAIDVERRLPAGIAPPWNVPLLQRSRGAARRTASGWVFLGGLAAVFAIALTIQFTESKSTASSQGAINIDTTRTDAAPTGTTAIAVLPFINLSSDPEQEFFSDGMTDEITAALAKVRDLRVVGRSSAFQFKGQNRDLRAVGQSLGTTHLIEGSVRKVRDRVRITVQVVRADNGLHVWAETYERELADIFAIQEEIAQAIAASLRVPLALQPGGTLVSNRDIDTQSYQQYLSARAIIRTRFNLIERRVPAITVMEQVAARYPGFAPAWAQLALAYMRMGAALPVTVTGEERRRIAKEWLPKAEAAAKRAIELDAELADGYTFLGVTNVLRGDYLRAEALYAKALELDRFHPEALHFYAILLGGVGRVEAALAKREQLLSIEPLVGVYNSNIETLLWIRGQTDTAIARAITRARSAPGALPTTSLARIYWSQGRHAKAADSLLTIRPGAYPDEMVEAAVRLLRAAPRPAPGQKDLPRLGGELDFVYLHVGHPQRILEEVEGDLAAGSLVPMAITPFWHSSYAPVRKTERFKTFARNAGLVEYWRAKGWPEFCQPVGVEDFACN
jgi:TolB-like protein/DNA-binding SARP family transcriptional activator